MIYEEREGFGSALVILSTFVMAAQPMCVAAEMADAEGFGAVGKKYGADEENEEEFA